jgi:hypothetical protein
MCLSSLVVYEFCVAFPSIRRDEDVGVGGDLFRIDVSRSVSRVLREIARPGLLFKEWE